MAELNFRSTVSALTESRNTMYSPVTGMLNSAVLHFPTGCNSLVEVFIYVYSRQLLPYPAVGAGASDNGIALDDATQSFSISESIGQGEPIEVVVNNHDAGFPHTISAIVLIEEEQKYTGP